MVYLNTASCGILSEDSLKNTIDFYKAMQGNSSTAAEYWRGTEQDRIRQTVARFLNAPAANIAFLPNFSFGINSVVQALNGDEKILLYKNDYPSLTDPFTINNFNITWVGSDDGFFIDIEEIKKLLLENRIDILAISHVQWLSGFKADIAALGAFCRQHGIIFIVDATQSLGALVTDIQAIDADVLIASNYKWMNAGFGTGIMYMADAFLEKYPPVISGFGNYIIKDGQFIRTTSVRNYEPGHTNIPGLLVLEAAINEKLEKGVDRIEAHNHRLTQLLLDGIKDLPVKLLGGLSMENRSSIVLMHDENGLGAYLTGQQVVVTKRAGMLRVSMHFYNTEADVNAFTGCLGAFLSKA